jgi:hypothetical protein
MRLNWKKNQQINQSQSRKKLQSQRLLRLTLTKMKLATVAGRRKTNGLRQAKTLTNGLMPSTSTRRVD